MQTLSKTEGIGGTLKNEPEDFVVEEIAKNGTVLEINKAYRAEDLGIEEPRNSPKFATFIMQKRDWNTVQALKTIARRFRRGIKSAGFAGTKDRRSISTQLCSVYGITPEQLTTMKTKDIRINGAWKSDDAVRLGDLLGNRFTVTLNGVQRPENIEKINAELGGIFPNYFGEQRFGIRDNNVQIGINIMKGNFEAAAMAFLTDTTNERNGEAVHAREQLKEELDFGRALQYFPGYLRYERLVLDHLAKVPTDFAGAIRRLPRSITLMFVHSVESHLFNREVNKRVKEGLVGPIDGDKTCAKNSYGLPDLSTTGTGKDFVVGNIVGYDSEPNQIEKELMEEIGITPEQFKVASMPELNCKGTQRVLFAPYLNFEHSEKENSATMRFSLPSGSYATVLLTEFIK